MRILGVDDHSPFVELLRIGIESVGLTGELYEDPDAFLSSLEASPGAWDLLLIDVELADRSGLDLLPVVRRVTSAPVVFLSGHSTEEIPLGAAADARVTCRTKPCSFDALLELLAGLEREFGSQPQA